MGLHYFSFRLDMRKDWLFESSFPNPSHLPKFHWDCYYKGWSSSSVQTTDKISISLLWAAWVALGFLRLCCGWFCNKFCCYFLNFTLSILHRRLLHLQIFKLRFCYHTHPIHQHQILKLRLNFHLLYFLFYFCSSHFPFSKSQP